MIVTPAASSAAAVAPVVRLHDHAEGRGNDRARDDEDRDRQDDEHAPTLVLSAKPRPDSQTDKRADEAARDEAVAAANAASGPSPVNDDEVIRLGDNRGPGHAPELTFSELVSLLDNSDTELAVIQDRDADAADNVPERFRAVELVSLSSIQQGLSSTDAATLSASATNHSAAIQAFLNGSSAQAVMLRSVLGSAGVDLASVIGLVTGDHDRLVLLTSA